jgi:hypothetical protein
MTSWQRIAEDAKKLGRKLSVLELADPRIVELTEKLIVEVAGPLIVEVAVFQEGRNRQARIRMDLKEL